MVFKWGHNGPPGHNVPPGHGSKKSLAWIGLNHLMSWDCKTKITFFSCPEGERLRPSQTAAKAPCCIVLTHCKLTQVDGELHLFQTNVSGRAYLHVIHIVRYWKSTFFSWQQWGGVGRRRTCQPAAQAPCCTVNLRNVLASQWKFNGRKTLTNADKKQCVLVHKLRGFVFCVLSMYFAARLPFCWSS